MEGEGERETGCDSVGERRGLKKICRSQFDKAASRFWALGFKSTNYIYICLIMSPCVDRWRLISTETKVIIQFLMTSNLRVWEGCGLFRFSCALMELMVQKESALLWGVRKIYILVFFFFVVFGSAWFLSIWGKCWASTFLSNRSVSWFTV